MITCAFAQHKSLYRIVLCQSFSILEIILRLIPSGENEGSLMCFGGCWSRSTGEVSREQALALLSFPEARDEEVETVFDATE